MNKKVLIVSANYYKDVSDSLKIGATNFLKENNIYFEIIDSPGSFEIPYIISDSLIHPKFTLSNWLTSFIANFNRNMHFSISVSYISYV